jgi:LysR family transcriptional regulator of gallate degradation
MSQTTCSLSLKQLKAVMLVGETGSVSRASSALARSQSATTKAITQVEKKLGVRLFDRIPSGMTPTPHGQVLLRRLRKVARQFDLARDAYRNATGKPERELGLPLFRMDVSIQRLEALVALETTRDPKRAAASLGITTHAVYRSLHQIQRELGLPLFERSTGGILESTPFARVLLTHLKLAFAEIRHAIAEIDSLDGIPQGRVKVGTLPPGRNVIVPMAINHVLARHPQIRLRISDGDLPSLEKSLRAGDLDMVVGTRHASSDYSDIVFEPLIDAPVCIIARRDHPLARRDSVSPAHLSDSQWIVPPGHTPQRGWLEQFLRTKGTGVPDDCVVTSTYEIIEEVLADSDRLAMATIFDLERFERRTPLAVLPVPSLLEYEKRMPRLLHVLLRAHSTMSPAAAAFYQSLIEVTRGLEQRSARQYRQRTANYHDRAAKVHLVRNARD